MTTAEKHEHWRQAQEGWRASRPSSLDYTCLCWKRRDRRGPESAGWAGHSPECWQFKMPRLHSNAVVYPEPVPEGGQGYIGPPPSESSAITTEMSWWNDEHNFFPEQWWRECVLPGLVNKLYRDLGLDAYSKWFAHGALAEGEVYKRNPDQPSDEWLEQFGGPTWPTTFYVIYASALDSMREYALRVKSGSYLRDFDWSKVPEGRSEREARQGRAFSAMAGPGLFRFLKQRRAQAQLNPDAHLTENQRLSASLGFGERMFDAPSVDGGSVTTAQPPYAEYVGGKRGRPEFEVDTGDDNPAAWLLQVDAANPVQPHDEDDEFLRRWARKSAKRGAAGFDREKWVLAQYVVTYWYDTYLSEQQRLAYNLSFGDPHDPKHTRRGTKPLKTVREAEDIYESFGYTRSHARRDRKEVEDAFSWLEDQFARRFATEWERAEARERTWTDAMFRQEAKEFVDDVVVGPNYPWRHKDVHFYATPDGGLVTMLGSSLFDGTFKKLTPEGAVRFAAEGEQYDPAEVAAITELFNRIGARRHSDGGDAEEVKRFDRLTQPPWERG